MGRPELQGLKTVHQGSHGKEPRGRAVPGLFSVGGRGSAFSLELEARPVARIVVTRQRDAGAPDGPHAFPGYSFTSSMPSLRPRVRL